MADESKITTDHTEIQHWTEERGGYPAVVEGTDKNGDGILRIDFPGYTGDKTLKQISWEEFFQIFDSKNLGFLYQEKTKDNQLSRFFKFVAYSK